MVRSLLRGSALAYCTKKGIVTREPNRKGAINSVKSRARLGLAL
jgi:hypothetical protein